MTISLEELTGFPNSRRWQGRWIWPAGCDPKKENPFARFRRTFSVKETKGLRIFISADTRYRLFVNGEMVGQGPPLSQPFFQYYNDDDISSALRPGENCIAVIVYHLGTLPQARGGLLAEVVDDAGRTILATDASWRATLCDAWQSKTYRATMNVTAPFQEHFDARTFPDGFTKCGFDDARWQPAEVITGRGDGRPPVSGPWSRLVPRDIAYLADRPVLAQRLDQVGEALALNNRNRGEDLSITLSQAIVPLARATIKEAENLVTGKGAASSGLPAITRKRSISAR